MANCRPARLPPPTFTKRAQGTNSSSRERNEGNSAPCPGERQPQLGRCHRGRCGVCPCVRRRIGEVSRCPSPPLQLRKPAPLRDHATELICSTSSLSSRWLSASWSVCCGPTSRLIFGRSV